MEAERRRWRVEWPTVAALAACYFVWLAATYALPRTDGPVMVAVLVLLILSTTFHTSLQHEALHGHPTRRRGINEALVWLPLGLFIPFQRFRALHLAHHCDSALTDPYDDPESFYRAGRDWARLSRPAKVLLTVNNTLAGRLLIGPALSLGAFAAGEARRIAAGERGVARAWVHHLAGFGLVTTWLIGVAGLSPVVYAALVAYPAFGLLMLRTFAEHQAHEDVGARTAIVERGGLFALLFLNNNLHVVHHSHPRAPWYTLPVLYRDDRDRYLAANGGYRFSGYGEIARRFLFRTKEPVVHPILHRD